MTHPDAYDLDDACDDDDDDGFDDCALDMDTGQCGHAGSEQCDFECPWRNTKYFAGNPGFRVKRKRKATP